MQADANAPVFATGEVEMATDPATIWNVMADIGRWPDWNPDITVATLHGPVQPGLGSVGRPDRAQSSRPSGSGAADRAVLDWQDDGNPGHPCLPAAR